jgi:hypothetical protein
MGVEMINYKDKPIVDKEWGMGIKIGVGSPDRSDAELGELLEECRADVPIKYIPPKFQRLVFVHIGAMPVGMSHFPANCDAIICGTYSDLYGGRDTKSYKVFLIDKKTNKCVTTCAWYLENQLTALPYQDSDAASKIIGEYYERISR